MFEPILTTTTRACDLEPLAIDDFVDMINGRQGVLTNGGSCRLQIPCSLQEAVEGKHEQEAQT